MKKRLSFYESRQGFEKGEILSYEGENALLQMDLSIVLDKYGTSRHSIGAMFNKFGGVIGALITGEFNILSMSKKLLVEPVLVKKELERCGYDLDKIDELYRVWIQDKNIWFNAAKEHIESYGDFYVFYIKNYSRRRHLCDDLKITKAEFKKLALLTGGKNSPIDMVNRRVNLSSAIGVLSKYKSIEAFIRTMNYNQTRIAAELGIGYYQWDSLVARTLGLEKGYINKLKVEDKKKTLITDEGDIIPTLVRRDFGTEKSLIRYTENFIKHIGGLDKLLEVYHYDVGDAITHLNMTVREWHDMVLRNPEYIRILFKKNFDNIDKDIDTRVDGLLTADVNIGYIKHIMRFMDRDFLIDYVVDYVMCADLSAMGVSEVGNIILDSHPSTLYAGDRTKLVGIISTNSGFRRESMIEECIVEYLMRIVDKCEDECVFGVELMVRNISMVKILKFCNTPIDTVGSIYKGMFALKGKENELRRYLNRMLNNGVFARTKFNPLNYRSDILTIIRALIEK